MKINSNDKWLITTGVSFLIFVSFSIFADYLKNTYWAVWVWLISAISLLICSIVINRKKVK
jgi:hypothetical protein